MIRTVLCFTATLDVWLNPASAASPVTEADILADRRLWAVGGGPAWASLTSTIAGQ